MAKPGDNVFDRIPTDSIEKEIKYHIKNSQIQKKQRKQMNGGDVRKLLKRSLDKEIEILNDMNKTNERIINKIKRVRWKSYTWPFIRKTAIVGITVGSLAFGAYEFLTNQYSGNDRNLGGQVTVNRSIDDAISKLRQKYSGLQDQKGMIQNDPVKNDNSLLKKNATLKGHIEKKDQTTEYIGSSSNRLEDKVEALPKKSSVVPVSVLDDNANLSTSTQDFYYFPVRGDTLSRIAFLVSGDMRVWRRIQEYNRLPTDIIEVNQPLKIPSDIVKDISRLYHGSLGYRTYTAGRTDTLETISRKLYGDSDHADNILEFNRKFNPYFSQRIWNREIIMVPGG